jgi:hypothetical protein
MRTYKLANRDQLLLLPPNLDDWIPPTHPVRFVLDAVEMLDLKPFYVASTDLTWVSSAPNHAPSHEPITKSSDLVSLSETVIRQTLQSAPTDRR